MVVRVVSRRRVRAQALVELALVLPILITIFSAVVHFGVLFYFQVSLEASVREASLWAAYNPRDDNRILEVARSTLPSLVNPSGVAIEVTTTGSRSVADPLTLQVDYDIQLLRALPFGAILPIPTRIHSVVTVPIVDANI